MHQFEIMPRPPEARDGSTPWPTYPLVYRVSSAHEEGGERVYSVNTKEFIGANGRVTKLRAEMVERATVDGRPQFVPVPGSEFELDADLVLLAMGFTGPQRSGLLDELGVELDGRGNVQRDQNWATSLDRVFACGDMGRGQSLIVWAIAEGRACAAAVDEFLIGETLLPRPVKPTDRPLS